MGRNTYWSHTSTTHTLQNRPMTGTISTTSMKWTGWTSSTSCALAWTSAWSPGEKKAPPPICLNALAYYFGDKLDINNPNIGLVHRIDKDTSGLLLIAKTPAAKTNLGIQFFEHTTERTYNALVWGTFAEDSGTIEGALARDNRDRTIYKVWNIEDNPNAKEAVTHWRVLERFMYVTLVECRLETGRTHQIRVHMKHIGHPLFCDEKYGGTEILKGLPTQKYKQYIHNCFDLCPRQVLHAKTLGFTHPVTGKRMFFDSEWPADMSNLIEKWRKYEPNTLG